MGIGGSEKEMAQVILDFGSGNTCKNDVAYIKRMIDALVAIDTHKHEVVIKWQLFKEPPASGGGSLGGKDIPLTHEAFTAAYEYAKEKGYRCTSSVFDKESLAFLLGFDVPFVKIACRPDLYWLAGEIERKIPVYISADMRPGPDSAERRKWLMLSTEILSCVPKYPADIRDYSWDTAFSDHVEGLGLWKAYKPDIWEKHFCLERDPSNPDSGPFAITPEELREIL